MFEDFIKNGNAMIIYAVLNRLRMYMGNFAS